VANTNYTMYVQHHTELVTLDPSIATYLHKCVDLRVIFAL